MLADIQKWAVIAQQIKCLRENDGWAGETHIQKALFFLQELLHVPMGYDFVLYKHGPYDFDLHDDLGSMLNNLIVALDHHPPYGPRFRLGSYGDRVIQLGNDAVEKYKDEIEFIADNLSNKDIRELERLGTALLLREEFPDYDHTTLATSLVELKPHVPESLAYSAVQEFLAIEKQAKSLRNISASS